MRRRAGLWDSPIPPRPEARRGSVAEGDVV